MAQEVKGMSIPIDADSTEAQKSFKELNADIKTSAILADKYNKALSFDDDGIIALQKQFANLADEEEALTAKQKKLNAQLAEMEADGKAGTASYKRLEIQLLSTQSSLKYVGDEQERVNKDIKAMETKQFDDLSENSKNANAEMKKLNQEMKELNDEADSSDMKSFNQQLTESAKNTDLFAKATNLATLAVNPYTIAIAGAAAGLKVYWERVQRTNEAQKAFTYNLEISSSDMTELGKQASITGKSLGLDYATSLEYANQEMRIFGDNIQNTADFQKYFNETVMISNSEMFDYDIVLAEMTSNQANFGDSIDKTTQIMATQTVMLQRYGRSADDSMDTFIEFGDTLAAVGLDAEESLSLMSGALVAGARNTDEMANAVNEFALRMTEADQKTKDALTSIGLNYDNLAKDITDKGIQYGIIEVVNGMNDFYEATAKTDGEFSALNQTMALGMQLFGTYGEEFIATFAANTEGVTGLNEAIEITNTRTQALADITTKTLKPAYDDFAKNTLPDLGAEAHRYNNILQNQGKLALINALVNEKKLVPAMQSLGLTIESLPEKYQNMATQILILADSEASWNEKKAASNQLMADETAIAMGNDTVMQARNATYETMANLQNRVSDGYFLTTQGTQAFTEALYASSETLNEYIGPMQNLNEEILRSITLNSDYDLNIKEVDKAVSKLKDGTANYSFYLAQANNEVVQGVAAQVLSNDQYDRAAKVIEQANIAYGSKTGTGYTARFTEAIQTSDDGEKSLKEYNQRLEDSKTNLDKMKSSLEKNTTKMAEFSKETNNAYTNLDNLNQATQTYNNQPVSSKSANISTQQATVARAGVTTQSAQTKKFGDIIVNITAPPSASVTQIGEIAGEAVSKALYDYGG